jgi:hypothetical protein
MSFYDSTTVACSFPAFAFSGGRKLEANELRFRPFGISESDLDIDFTHPNTPALITRLLVLCCAERKDFVSNEFFWDLSVGKRLECLLWIANLGKADGFLFQFKCANEACRQELAFDLLLSEITEMQQKADETQLVSVNIADENFYFRKPSGRDQIAWQEKYWDETETAQMMISSLQVKDEKPIERLDDEAIVCIGEAMDEVDPLINFTCKVTCPDCGLVNDYEVDLTTFALNELQKAQRDLLKNVHLLASHYKWSEQQFFSVPHWRRQVYLSLIAKDSDR